MPEISINNTKTLILKIRQQRGIDLGIFALNILRYKIDRIMLTQNIRSVDLFTARIIDDNIFYQQFISNFFCMDLELFRDPEFWQVFNNTLPRLLKNFNDYSILVPACDKINELASLTIALEQQKLKNQFTIDISWFNENTNCNMLTNSERIKPKDLGIENFQKIFPNAQINKYFDSINDSLVFKSSLFKIKDKQNHDLLLSGIKKKYNLILFRDKLLNYSKSQQDKVVLNLVAQLENDGVIIFGFRENPVLSRKVLMYLDIVDEKNRIYRKK